MNIGIKNTSNRNNAVQKHKAQDILHSIKLSKHFNIPSENENFSSNCIVIGSAGCGKTKGFVIPNLLEGEDSFVVLDLKHEILNSFQSPETKTYVLDLKTQNGGYNPFDYIENKEDAARFSECLYQLVVNREFVDGAEESFKETEKKILTAYIKFIAYGYGYNPIICGKEVYEKNPRGLYKLAMSGKIKEYAEKAKQIIGKLPSCFHVLFDENEKIINNIVSKLSIEIASFLTEEVLNLTDKSSFHLSELYNEKERTGLFIELDDYVKENSFATLVIWQIADRMKAMKEHGEFAKYVVNFYLDNFEMIPRLPGARELFASARNSRYNFILCFRTLTGFASRYMENAEEVLATCSYLVFYPETCDEKTMEFVEAYKKSSLESVENIEEINSIFKNGRVMISAPGFPVFVDTALHEKGYIPQE